jgi:hypothetical protein
MVATIRPVWRRLKTSAAFVAVATPEYRDSGLHQQQETVRHNAGAPCAVASLAFGMAPLLAVWAVVYEPFLVFAFGITSPLAVVFGQLADRKLQTEASAFAIAGLILGYLGTAWLLFFLVVVLPAFDGSFIGM